MFFLKEACRPKPTESYLSSERGDLNPASTNVGIPVCAFGGVRGVTTLGSWLVSQWSRLQGFVSPDSGCEVAKCDILILRRRPLSSCCPIFFLCLLFVFIMAISSFSQELGPIKTECKGLDLFFGPQKEILEECSRCRVIGLRAALGNLVT